MSFGSGFLPEYLERIQKSKERSQSRGYHEKMQNQGFVKSKVKPHYPHFSKKEKEAFNKKIQDRKQGSNKRLIKAVLLTLLFSLLVFWLIQRLLLWAFF